MGSMAPSGQIREVFASMRTPLANLEVVNYSWQEPSEGTLGSEEDHLIDLCLTPRPTGSAGCFPEHWPSHRHERLGDIFLVPAGYMLQGRTVQGQQRSLVCQLKSKAMQELAGVELRWSERHLDESIDLASPAVRMLLGQLTREMRAPGLASEVMVEALVMALAVELARYHADLPERLMTGGLAPWCLRRIDERLMEADELPRLTELAALCHISVRHLSRGFKNSRGVAIGEYIASIRIERARAMLAGQRSIKEIAHAAGYGSASSFSNAFRRATGQAPREFRHMARP